MQVVYDGAHNKMIKMGDGGMDILENWMHASDEEREQIQHGWNPALGEGKDIATEVAAMFRNECIYGIVESEALYKNDRWFIKAYAKPDDYESLKTRGAIEFLGFRVIFHNVNER